MAHVSLADTTLVQEGQAAAFLTAAFPALSPTRGAPASRTMASTAAAAADGMRRVWRVLQDDGTAAADVVGVHGSENVTTVETKEAAAALPDDDDNGAGSKVFIASAMESCSLCDVGPGNSILHILHACTHHHHQTSPPPSFLIVCRRQTPTTTPGTTAGNVGGAGRGSCRLSDSCDEKQEKEAEADASAWWAPPAGAGPANTSIAVLRLRATFSPPPARRRRRRGLEGGRDDGVVGVAPAHVLAALQNVSRGAFLCGCGCGCGCVGVGVGGNRVPPLAPSKGRLSLQGSGSPNATTRALPRSPPTRWPCSTARQGRRARLQILNRRRRRGRRGGGSCCRTRRRGVAGGRRRRVRGRASSWCTW